jgi:hypothetical protein
VITHRRNALVSSWFSHMAKGQLKKNFRKCSLTPDSVIPAFEPGVPVVGILNHSSWWDAMLVLYLSHFILKKKESYGLFDEEQLKRYGIFRLVGCFSINRTSGIETRKFIRYTRDLLVSTERLFWIFPQGELVSNERPVELKSGFAQLVSFLPKVQLLKVAVSYDFWIESKPEMVIDIAPIETLVPLRTRVYVNELSSRIRLQMQNQMTSLRQIVKNRDSSGLKPLFVREHGAHPMYDIYRSLKASLNGKAFRKSHGEN